MASNKKKIVIAEDNLDLCYVLKEILEENGYETNFVHDGYLLIDHLKKNRTVDAVILDLIMPEKGGVSVFDTIRSLSPGSKLIIYTGYASYRNSVFARGADAFIDKTEGSQKILKTLAELL
jgi:CheY-like chemotaxis protein